MGSADVAVRRHLENWQDPKISVAELEDVYDPAHARRLATHTASLREDADIDQFAARAEDSSAGAAANAASAKAGATAKRAGGYSLRRTEVRINAAGQLTATKRKETLTGEQVQERERRKLKRKELPPQLLPTYKRQKLAPGSGLIRKRAAGKGHVVKRRHARGPPSKRSRAEISAQARNVRKLADGRYRVVILKTTWSDKELENLGFPKKNDKRLRFWDFKGPTAKGDAEAFDKKMTEWLENPNRAGPPPLS